MAYTRPTSLRVPLSRMMEWAGKRSLLDIEDDLCLETKKLASDKLTNELAANIHFAWKLDSLQLADGVGDNEDLQPSPAVSGEEGEKWEDCEAVSRVSGKAEAGCGGSYALSGAAGRERKIW
jgi:hypothetical protein